MSFGISDPITRIGNNEERKAMGVKIKPSQEMGISLRTANTQPVFTE